jgi:hypothetical protein
MRRVQTAATLIRIRHLLKLSQQSSIRALAIPYPAAAMYESKQKPLAPRGKFVLRVLLHGLVAALLLLASLELGIVGYEHYEHLPWIDAFLNAAMLLGGMGPVNAPMTFGGKLFAGLYALYAGLIFLITAGLVFTPVMHRILHRFHLEQGR